MLALFRECGMAEHVALHLEDDLLEAEFKVNKPPYFSPYFPIYYPPPIPPCIRPCLSNSRMTNTSRNFSKSGLSDIMFGSGRQGWAACFGVYSMKW
jgi:hypothetical protein